MNLKPQCFECSSENVIITEDSLRCCECSGFYAWREDDN